jgi:hypothetical protein
LTPDARKHFKTGLFFMLLPSIHAVQRFLMTLTGAVFNVFFLVKFGNF